MATQIGSLIDQAYSDYVANCGYEENQSRAQALAFITACRKLIGLRPLATSRAEMGSLNFESLPLEIESARRWLAMNPQSRFTHRLFSGRDYRDRGINPRGFGTDS